MTRQTSIDSYNTLRDSGALGRRRWEAYDDVFRNGPCTSGELAQRTGMTKRDAASRCAELRTRGLLRELGTQVCTTSGRTVISWDVTARNAPIPQPPKDAAEPTKRDEDSGVFCPGCRYAGRWKYLPNLDTIRRARRNGQPVLRCVDCGSEMKIQG
jgi:hypothetical protein